MDFVILGVMTLVAGIVCLRLPETRGKAMPETIESLDKLSSGPVEVKQVENMTEISEQKLKLLEDQIENSLENA